ncbi:hypothetical protein [Bacillus altitudinis]|uniref:hypothetical protein n=1 Tax=Bacillus altitudinis TaxID=293387 RepID=UPI001643DE77|nr:hypothetical protein [Bacillus altitudinis]
MINGEGVKGMGKMGGGERGMKKMRIRWGGMWVGRGNRGRRRMMRGGVKFKKGSGWR